LRAACAAARGEAGDDTAANLRATLEARKTDPPEAALPNGEPLEWARQTSALAYANLVYHTRRARTCFP